MIDRFINVHPYAPIEPARSPWFDPDLAETAKTLLKVGSRILDEARRSRVALDVYVVRESPDEVTAKLAEAEEELVKR